MPRSRVRRLSLLTVVGAVLAAASIPAAASAAAQRYASPVGAGSGCSSATPCSITQAISGAGAGDEVIVNPGDYPLTATLSAPSAMTIHGVAGQPRPRLHFSGAGQGGLRLYFGGTLRYMEIDQAANEKALFAAGASVDQVIAKASVTGEPTASIRGGTIRNSIVVTSATNGTALSTGTGSGETITSTYRNVTAIATAGGGVPIAASASTGSSATIHLVNVIAYAGPDALSLLARTDNSGAQAKITATHTNYQSADSVGSAASLVDGGGNRAEEPAFLNPAAGDYRQAAGAYTIDAGLNDPINGAFDVDGDPRAIGTTDIGADEFVPATTPPATPPPTTPPPSTSPPTTPPPTTPPSAQPFAGVKLVSTRLTFGGRFITLKLSCPAATVGRCSGRSKLTARRRASSGAARSVTLGRASFSIAPGTRGKVRVRVARSGRRLLSGVRRLRGRDINAARDAAGQSKTTVAAVTIRRRHR
jgi:hypothetical protein